jgi:hypothetical protein
MSRESTRILDKKKKIYPANLENRQIEDLNDIARREGVAVQVIIRTIIGDHIRKYYRKNPKTRTPSIQQFEEALEKVSGY